MKLTKVEIQSGFDRLKFAEGLVRQLPRDHDGRNTWLLNYGRGEEAENLRLARNIVWDDETQAAITFPAKAKKP